MPKFNYNPNNTEGIYPTSIDFIDTEVKKGNKIIATDIVDLYDTYPESQTPNQGDALVYDSIDGIWKPGEGAGGSSCNVFEGYDSVVNIPFDAVHVSCGHYHTLAIKQDGTLWATGQNYGGQLGLGDNVDRNVFNQVGTDTDWNNIYCGSQHTSLIKNNGTIWTTGRNFVGQLGLGDNINRNVFNQVGNDTDWKLLYGGYLHTLAIKSNGILYATGWNRFGQLGLGDNDDRNVFEYLFTYEYKFKSKLVLNNNHSIKKIINVNFNTYIINYNYTIPILTHINIDDLSITSFDNINEINNNYTSYLDISSKSIVNINNFNIKHISSTDSICNIDNCNYLLNYNLINNSTLIIKKQPIVYPVIHNYESIYIINGISQ